MTTLSPKKGANKKTNATFSKSSTQQTKEQNIRPMKFVCFVISFPPLCLLLHFAAPPKGTRIKPRRIKSPAKLLQPRQSQTFICPILHSFLQLASY